MIYLDNNATTRVAPEVFAAMRPFLEDNFANPSSSYGAGQLARIAVEAARAQVAYLLGAATPEEILFTSCGTESDNLAIRGSLALRPNRRHIVTSSVEHEAVRKLCEFLSRDGYEVTWLSVSSAGLIDPAELAGALRPDTGLVSVMAANNETGVLFPVAELAALVHAKSDALFHVDGVQAVGKIPFDLKQTEIDLFSISGHKLYAPKGVGALYVRKEVALQPESIGGGQERGLRAGTEAVPNIVALGAACDLVAQALDQTQTSTLRDRLETAILSKFANARVNGTRDRKLRLPNTSSISCSYIEGEMILAHLDQRGICVSTGSACNSSTHQSSPVLRAMNIPYTDAMGSVRFSTGRYNTERDIADTIAALTEIIPMLINISPFEAELSQLGCLP